MKGICTNWDCPKFDENGKIVQDIPDGEDFVCQNPECGHKLHEVSDTGGSAFKIPLIIVAAVLVVAAVVLFLLFGYKKGKDETPIPPSGSTTVIADTVKPIEQQPKDTVYIVKDTTIYKTDTIVRETKTTVITPAGGEKTTASTKSYPFGKYVGSLENGIPEGDGAMTYTRRVQVAKHDTQNHPHYAEAGDYFKGSWGNGDIVSGTLYNKDGAIKEKIRAPKRFNAYDINND